MRSPADSPDRGGRLTKRVVTRQLLTGEAALDALLHAGGELPGLDQVHVHLLHVAEVEEVALPFDLGVGVEPEPAAADPVDLLRDTVAVERDLLPEADDLALFV